MFDGVRRAKLGRLLKFEMNSFVSLRIIASEGSQTS